MNWVSISQKTAFFIVTAVKTANLTLYVICHKYNVIGTAINVWQRNLTFVVESVSADGGVGGEASVAFSSSQYAISVNMEELIPEFFAFVIKTA
jgi:hypothetical protein